MTKQKALCLLLQYSREVVEPSLASKIVKALGYNLSELESAPKKLKTFHRLNYNPQFANTEAISISSIAKEIAELKSGEKIYSNINGAGSYADDIVKQSVEILNGKQLTCQKCGEKIEGYIIYASGKNPQYVVGCKKCDNK